MNATGADSAGPSPAASPEATLLLLCARPTLDDAAATQLRALAAGPLCWDLIVQLALRNCVGALVQQHLATLCAEWVPASTQALLAEHARAVALSNLASSAELVRLLGLFEREDMPVLPLKGPLIALQAYGSLALRPFDDLDILIRRPDFERAWALLIGQGYVPYAIKDPAEHQARLREHHDYLLVCPRRGTALDLQWRLLERPFRFPAKINAWWERATRIELLGRPVRTLAPEDLLLMLCAHGSKHLWVRLSWIRDVAGLIAGSPGLCWELTFARAEREGATRMLNLGLLLARQLLAAELPEEVDRRVAGDRVARQLARQVREYLFHPPDTPVSTLDDAALFYLRMRERWRDRIGLGVSFAPALCHPLQSWRRNRARLLKARLRR